MSMKFDSRSNVRRLLATMALATASLAAQAQQGPFVPPTVAEDAATPVARAVSSTRTKTYKLTLKDLGLLYPMQLRGVDGINSVPFSVRSDEVIVGAKVDLSYTYSPALLPDLSHLKVIVNDDVIDTIPVPRNTAGQALDRQIPIPVQNFADYNRLAVQLIGHYTLECEDPLNSTLWANVSNNSVLTLDVIPVALKNDLSLLPLPFFDRRDINMLDLPFVFPEMPDNGVLEAAGATASWFGALASYRGARFNVARSVPEQGNAVVFMTGRERLAGVSVPSNISGPTLSVVTNPRDSTGKLLLVMGRDSNEIKLAAQALTLGGVSLSGQTATITSIDQVKPRLPYDAPNWLRSDRAVKFGELVTELDELQVSGYSPDLIRVDFRLPPDLFAWRDKGIPVDLKYRYTPRMSSHKASLNVNVSDQFLKSYPLAAAGQVGESSLDRLVNRILPADGQPVQEQFDIPLFKLPSRAQLQFHYYYDPLKEGSCRDVVLDNVKGSVEPDSTIDISGFSHFIAMPDLAAFSNTGFPFTRLADLSETVVVMPEKPGVSDFSAYLTLMGRMGESTGYPVVGVTVAQGNNLGILQDRDLLVLGNSANQPLLSEWASHIPAAEDGKASRFGIADFVNDALAWWNRDGEAVRRDVNANLSYRSDSTDGVIAGFESPLSAGRSVVLVSSGRNGTVKQTAEALLDTDLIPKIQGSLVVVKDKDVVSLLAEPSYYTGSLPFLLHIQWYLSSRPWLMLLLALGCALLLAFLIYAVLRAKAKARLKGD